jgi:uncharacterized SAM-binding protein YcdF (DUF218 family)
MRFIGACLIVLMVLSAASAAALLLAEPLLTIRTTLDGNADMIVVLGGDGPPRAEKAAQLWLDGAAATVLVTGSGDCISIRETMIEKGVDRDKIEIECRSRSTWENAVFSASFVSRMRVGRAILVTSWFHSRRALNCFEAIMPNVDWLSIPSERQPPYRALLLDANDLQILKEYPKAVVYWLRALLSAHSALTVEAGMSVGRGP